ncbi:uncharacterized protein LOC133722244 [Rosa rugosa]|uniref:uncharacterized protein LOC133722244 n=1 Tax=Rosa rugosa TaxID=74645 RepID=UPI002B405BB8|nr:uncharacterized protein LOC133722244 [Rosa rugosa]
MEMESNIILKNQKLGAFDILRKALGITTTNINFFLFTIFASLPLFCFLVYNQPFLQEFQDQVLEILKHPAFVYYFEEDTFKWSLQYDATPGYDVTPEWNKRFPGELIQQALLYLVPLHLLELITALAIAVLASKIYKEERPMTLKEMVNNQPFDKITLKAFLITAVYVLVLSTCSDILGSVWSAASYSFVFRYFNREIFLSLWCCIASLAMLTTYLAWNVIWNMSIVISLLEGIHGIKAFGLVTYLSTGNGWGGFLLMFIFFAWEVTLRLPCLYFGCKGRGNGMFVAQSILLCFGNVFELVVFVIYFHDCKNRVSEKLLMIKANKAGDQSCV